MRFPPAAQSSLAPLSRNQNAKRSRLRRARSAGGLARRSAQREGGNAQRSPSSFLLLSCHSRGIGTRFSSRPAVFRAPPSLSAFRVALFALFPFTSGPRIDLDADDSAQETTKLTASNPPLSYRRSDPARQEHAVVPAVLPYPRPCPRVIRVPIRVPRSSSPSARYPRSYPRPCPRCGEVCRQFLPKTREGTLRLGGGRPRCSHKLL